ncbi:16S rRNA (cytidine(1402)-2'-O)-methyltransferase [Candidatus Peribacteria bacterium]|nr:16S rRNA (cytidine(1402)-2'-O)-methyltransferase [Candidatus Peribacteria bacterium]
MPVLYMVATPIGNRGDITYRAVETLQRCDLLVCEDTRHTARLCELYAISTLRRSFHAQSSPAELSRLLDAMDDCETVCYVSDSGTPGVSDPGYRLVRAALDRGYTVLPLPGPSALTALLSTAGVPVNTVTFHGFLPHKKGRQTLLQGLVTAPHSQVFYESVHRFPRLLTELQQHLGPQRYLVVGRELTKLHEEVFRGSVAAAIEHFTAENTRGEFVVLVAPPGWHPV